MKEKLIEKLYEMTKKPYQKWFKKNEPWKITKEKLLTFPKGSIGL